MCRCAAIFVGKSVFNLLMSTISTPKNYEVGTKIISYSFLLFRASATPRTTRPRTCAPHRFHRSGQQSIFIPINLHLNPNATAIVASVSSNSFVAAPPLLLSPPRAAPAAHPSSFPLPATSPPTLLFPRAAVDLFYPVLFFLVMRMSPSKRT
jgi:hypothetical protein